jgi:hypothetical protein
MAPTVCKATLSPLTTVPLPWLRPGNTVAADGSDRLQGNTVAADGSDRLQGNTVA